MFVICIESSHRRGLGHLFRALTLAAALRERGMAVTFLVNDHALSIARITAQGFACRVYPLDASPGTWEPAVLAQHPEIKVWINDRLDMPEAHARCVAAAGVTLVTFDDRSEAARLAALNVSALVFDDRDALHGQRVVCGLDHMILNPELACFRRPRERLGSLLVSLGGADTHGATVRVVRLLAHAGLAATVVTGPAFAHFDGLARAISEAEGLAFVHKADVPSLAEEMSHHDLAITGGGLTPFEAAVAGLPTIVVANEDFEVPVGLALEALGVSRFAGPHGSCDLSMLTADLPVAAMSRAALAALDLHGADRVADLIRSLA